MVIPSPSDAAQDLPTLLLQWQDRAPANGENDFVFLDCPPIGTAKCLNAKVHLKQVVDYAKYRKGPIPMDGPLRGDFERNRVSTLVWY